MSNDVGEGFGRTQRPTYGDSGSRATSVATVPSRKLVEKTGRLLTAPPMQQAVKELA